MLVRTKGKGFTLIELLIVIAVISILAALAYPSYQESVRKARRADAQGVMTELAQWMERNYTQANSYSQKSDGTAITTPPAGLDKSPKEGNNKYYDITFQPAPTANAYTIVATPINGQDDDKCGKFTLTSTGVQNITEQHSGVTKEECWRK